MSSKERNQQQTNNFVEVNNMENNKKENNILLDSSGDLFGLKPDDVFNAHSENFNVVNFRIDNPRRVELSQARYHTDFQVFISDDTEQLEKLIKWAQTLQKGAKKHLKKLNKKLEQQKKLEDFEATLMEG
tara:strand:- start:93 stop:482 length:390 start_codon:yes stop_codon:yes gene_type:complete